MKNKFLVILVIVAVAAGVVYQFFPNALRGLKSSVVESELANITGEDSLEFENGDGVTSPDRTSSQDYWIDTKNPEKDYTIDVTNGAVFSLELPAAGGNCTKPSPTVVHGECSVRLTARFKPGKSEIRVSIPDEPNPVVFTVTVHLNNSTRILPPSESFAPLAATHRTVFLACRNDYGQGELDLTIASNPHVEVSGSSPATTTGPKKEIKIVNPNPGQAGDVTFTADCGITSEELTETVSREIIFPFIKDESADPDETAGIATQIADLNRPLTSVLQEEHFTMIPAENPNVTEITITCKETQSLIPYFAVMRDFREEGFTPGTSSSKVLISDIERGVNADYLAYTKTRITVDHTKDPNYPQDPIELSWHCRQWGTYGGSDAIGPFTENIALRDAVIILEGGGTGGTDGGTGMIEPPGGAPIETGGPGKITIKKDTVPDSDVPFTFVVKNLAAEDAMPVRSPFLSDNGEEVIENLPLGSYEIEENILYTMGHMLTDISCDPTPEDPEDINVAANKVKVTLTTEHPEITCTFTNKKTARIFVSAETLPANFGGTKFADSLCRSSAINAALMGVNWKAIVSDKDRNAKDVIPENVAFVRLPCVKFDSDDQHCDAETGKLLVANDKADLLDGEILEPVTRTQFGYHFAADASLENDGKPWTGSKADGKKAENTCEDWTKDEAEKLGASGDASKTDSKFLERADDACSTGDDAEEHAVFCVETFEADPFEVETIELPMAWTNPDSGDQGNTNEPFEVKITVPEGVTPGEPVDIEFSIKPKP